MPNAKRFLSQSVSHFRLSLGLFFSWHFGEGKIIASRKVFWQVLFPSRSVCLRMLFNIPRVLFVMSSMSIAVPSTSDPRSSSSSSHHANKPRKTWVCVCYYTWEIGGRVLWNWNWNFAEKRLKEEREGGESFPSLGDYAFNFFGRKLGLVENSKYTVCKTFSLSFFSKHL